MGLRFYSSAPISIVLCPADYLMALIDTPRVVPLRSFPTALLVSRRSNPMGSRPSYVKVATILLWCALCCRSPQSGDICYRLPLVPLGRFCAVG